MDHVVKLETSIRGANIQKQHLIAIFFDLEKVYETTWKLGIMKDLHSLGLQGRLLNLIKSFLLDQQFQIRIRWTFSNLYKQEEGVLQGSILSVTLFNIKINSITRCLTPGIDGYLHVDDFCIISRSKYMRTAEHQLQQCINKITQWANTDGFKIPKSKMGRMHFCQLRNMHNDPIIKLEDTEIPVINKYKFLGVIFNRKLSFISHIKYFKSKTTCAQQLLWVVIHTKWGANRQALLKLYRALVHSQLDYGIFIYRSARKSYFKKLDPIHHKGLRLVLGTFRTSSAVSLYTKAHEAPLQLRCEKLALQYYTKLKSCTSNLAYECIYSCKYKQQYEQKEKTIKPFGFRMKPIHQESEISVTNIHKKIQIPPWIIKKQQVILQLNKLPKTKTHPSTYLGKFPTILLHHPDHQYIFTDGSKDINKTVCAAVLNKTIHKKATVEQ